MVHLIMAGIMLIAIILRNRGKYIQAIPFVLLAIFASIRYMYGSDYLSYYQKYIYIQNGSTLQFDESFYTLLNQICPNFFILIALTSIIFIFVIYMMIVNNVDEKYICVGILIFIINPYLMFINLSAIRQCLAMVCFICAVHFAIKKKIIPYVLLVLLATQFHKSAWLLLPIYFLANGKKIKKLYIIIIIIILIAILFVFDISWIVQLVAELFNDKNYSVYASQDLHNSLQATFLACLYFLYVITNINRLDSKSIAYSKLYLLGLILGILAFKFSMFTRLQMYFDIFSVVSIPMIFKNNTERQIIINEKNVLFTYWECINKYAMPVLLLIIYILKYYSFFTNQMWEPYFNNYNTIFSLF